MLDHNAGKSIYTKPFKPWILVGFLGFNDESKALKFEKYLKSNAGRIFLKRYFNDEIEVLACFSDGFITELKKFSSS